MDHQTIEWIKKLEKELETEREVVRILREGLLKTDCGCEMDGERAIICDRCNLLRITE